MSFMDTSQQLSPRKAGQQLRIAERNILIAKMIDKLCEGYVSTYKLAKDLRVNRATIESYRPLCDDIIAKTKLDRNVIRNLQVKRTYLIIEQLMEDLKEIKKDRTNSNVIKDRALIYASIYKFSSHLALITGLNVETHVTVDPTKLVIIRANKTKKRDRVTSVNSDLETTDSVNDLPQLTEGTVVE